MTQLLFEGIENGTKDASTKREIINFYINNGDTTITELSNNIALSIPTTSRLVNEMCDDGYVEDLGKLATSEGRHPNLYGLSSNAAFFVGVDMTRDGLNIGLCNFRGEMITLEMGIPYKRQNGSEAFEELCTIISNFIDTQHIDKKRILSVHINISGRVNPKSGYSYSIFYFDEQPLSEKFEKRLGYSTSIDNDTRSMTFGEYMLDSTTKEKNIVFVNLSWGIAIGMIIEGKIYYGKSGFAGEFGHIKTYDNEILCHCGKKGCLETEISGRYLHEKLLRLIKEGEMSSLTEKVSRNEEISIQDIVNAVIEDEDILCIELVEELGQKLGEQLAGIINLLNPEVLIIGGTLSKTEEYLMQPIKVAIRKYSLNLVNRDSKVIVSKLKDKAGVVGACLLARTNIFNPYLHIP